MEIEKRSDHEDPSKRHLTEGQRETLRRVREVERQGPSVRRKFGHGGSSGQRNSERGGRYRR